MKSQINTNEYHYFRPRKDFLIKFVNQRNLVSKKIRELLKTKKHLKINISKRSSKQTLYEKLVYINKMLIEKQECKDINIWQKKFEVFGRLFESYDRKNIKIKDSILAGPNIYLEFANCLLLTYSLKNDVKYFSTFLKVIDLLCSMEYSSFSRSNLKLFVKLIKHESKVIKKFKSEIIK